MSETAQARYDKENTRQIILKLNKKTDADILLKLDETSNKQGYLKSLIRQDIKEKQTALSADSLRYCIQPVVRRFSLDKVILFGSYARGEATDDSDVDLLVEGGNVYSLGDFLNLQEAFETAIGKKVDVVDSSVLHKNTRSAKRFKENIERDKVILYERIN